VIGMHSKTRLSRNLHVGATRNTGWNHMHGLYQGRRTAFHTSDLRQLIDFTGRVKQRSVRRVGGKDILHSLTLVFVSTGPAMSA